MYTVKYKPIEGINVKNFKQNFLKTDEGRETLEELADTLGVMTPRLPENNDPNYVELNKLVRKALALNWVASETKRSKLSSYGSVSVKKMTIDTTDVNEFNELYAADNMGVHNLMPGEECELVDDVEVINQLIQSPLAVWIEIKDPRGNKVYDGGIVDYSHTQQSFDRKGDPIDKLVTLQRTGNTLHPHKANELYKPKTKKANPTVTDADSLLS